MRQTTLPAGSMMALLASACWGGATVMSKGALANFSPTLLLVLQICASVAVLWLVILIRGLAIPPLGKTLRFAWLGLLEPGLAYFLGLSGLVDATAGAATLILTTESVMILALSFLLLGERISVAFALLSILALGGLPLALGIGSSVLSFGSLVGFTLLAAGTLSAAFYVVLSSRFVARHDPFVIVASQQTTALIFALALLPWEFRNHSVPSLHGIPISVWLLAALSGIIQYAVAFSLYLAAMRSVSTALAGMFLTFIPIFGLAGAYLFLGETLSATQLFGAAVTVGALLLLSISQRRSPA